MGRPRMLTYAGDASRRSQGLGGKAGCAGLGDGLSRQRTGNERIPLAHGPRKALHNGDSGLCRVHGLPDMQRRRCRTGRGTLGTAKTSPRLRDKRKIRRDRSAWRRHRVGPG